MIMFNIAEWIANVLVLGLGVFFWTLAFSSYVFNRNQSFINQIQK